MKTLSEILIEIDSAKTELDKHRPLSPFQLKNIEDALFVEYTYESNRIEGNTFTLQETALVIQKGITIAGKAMREHLEAINHFEAIGFIKMIAEKKEALRERTLKDIHSIILRSIDSENAGRYRTVNVKIAGSTHIPVDALKIQEKMDEYFRFYIEQKDLLHPVLLSANLHEKFVTIHPFIDGNGRTARLIMNLILMSHGYCIVNITGSNESRLSYYNTLEKCQTENSCDDFHMLVANAELHSINQYLNLIKSAN